VESIVLAKRQETIAWQLRAATSLAGLQLRGNNRAKAHDTLAPVYASFNEGFETADLRDAKELLDLVSPSAKASKRPTRRS
jgi:predicted ATPase